MHRTPRQETDHVRGTRGNMNDFGLLCTPRRLRGSSAALGLEGSLELSAGLRFRDEVFDSALMSTRTVAAAVWERERVRVERDVVRRLKRIFTSRSLGEVLTQLSIQNPQQRG